LGSNTRQFKTFPFPHHGVFNEKSKTNLFSVSSVLSSQIAPKTAVVQWLVSLRGWVAVLARSHTNGSIPLERTIEQTTETMPLALLH